MVDFGTGGTQMFVSNLHTLGDLVGLSVVFLDVRHSTHLLQYSVCRRWWSKIHCPLFTLLEKKPSMIILQRRQLRFSIFLLLGLARPSGAFLQSPDRKCHIPFRRGDAIAKTANSMENDLLRIQPLSRAHGLYARRKLEEEALGTRNGNIFFTSMMFLLPVASIIFPGLLQLAKSFPPNSSEQFAAITALFVSNRVYIYSMSATIVGLAAIRGSQDSARLGGRIVDLTEELLYRPTLDVQTKDSSTDSADTTEKPTLIQSLSDSGVEDSLNEVSTETQALVLPLLVSFLLALSVFLVPFFNDTAPTAIDESIASEVQDLIQTVLPVLTQGWNTILLLLFTRSEIRRSANELSFETPAIAEWGLASGITGLACFAKLWQAQNFVNMALAILVARVIQLDQFGAVVGALGLLTLYDATSVFLIPAAGASEMDLMATDHSTVFQAMSPFLLSSEPTAASSAMGSVAIQKLTSGAFQPGLLVTKIGDRLGGSLGLGDAVFPSVLAGFVKRFDNQQMDSGVSGSKRASLFAASMVGYFVGCFACEFAPLLSKSGLPALLFIIPAMLLTAVGTASITGELDDLIKFDPKQEDT